VPVATLRQVFHRILDLNGAGCLSGLFVCILAALLNKNIDETCSPGPSSSRFFISCNDSNSDIQAVENDTTQSNTGKPSLSAALDKLRLTLQAGQKEDIVDLISFPLTESQMDLYVDDSLFQQDFVAAGNKLTRDLFLKHYDKIAKFTYLDEIGNVFSHLSIDSLAHNSEIKKEYKDKEEP